MKIVRTFTVTEAMVIALNVDQGGMVTFVRKTAARIVLIITVCRAGHVHSDANLDGKERRVQIPLA